MRRGQCRRHGAQQIPCSCGLGRMYRLVEPVLLSLLSGGEAHYGYELIERANREALTDSEIDAAVVYRTLRTLEDAGCVTSTWEPGAGGPRRRMYRITDVGRAHLDDWLTVMGRHAGNLRAFVSKHKQSVS